MKRMLINVAYPEESRVAIVDHDGRQSNLLEIYIERPTSKTILGNVYKAVVVNIEPSIQAAFVDCGEGQNGFLHVSDIMPLYGRVHEGGNGNGNGNGDDEGGPHRRDRKIQDLLRLGQEVLVRVSKEAIGGKGPTLTTYLSLPGRGVVLMPSLIDRVRVSSKIEDERRRAKLREVVDQLDPPRGMGYILRTAAEEMTPDELGGDLRFLLGLWGGICRLTQSNPAPSLVYSEPDLVTKTLRDVHTSDIQEVIVDTEEAYQKAKAFFGIVSPGQVERIKLHQDLEPLFIKYEIEDKIDKIYEHKVPLPSGGSIVLEQTEALVAIDVNSGRGYTGEKDIEETALRTNLEAVREIARQLRLRDMGGVIINDLIDMRNLSNRRQVENEFRELLDKDRARTKMSTISQFGIIEMTRQRVGPSVKRHTHETCPNCNGTGWIRNLESMSLLCMRRIHIGLRDRRVESIEIAGHPKLLDKVEVERKDEIAMLRDKSGKKISFRRDDRLPLSKIEASYTNAAAQKVGL